MPLTADGYPYETDASSSDDTKNPLMQPSALDELLGRNGVPRYQLAPERMARHAAEALKKLFVLPHDEIMKGLRGEPGIEKALQVGQEVNKYPSSRDVPGQRNTGPVSSNPLDPYTDDIMGGLNVALGSARPLGALAGVPKDTLGTFVGRGSAIWNQETADTARAATRLGITRAQTPDEVWRRTGYGGVKPPPGVAQEDAYFADRMMRTEVNDSSSHLKNLITDASGKPAVGAVTVPANGQSYSLPSMLHHPELYAAEPRLAQIQVVGDTSVKEGAFSMDNRAIHLNPNYARSISPDELHSLILHEVQHGADQLYGFGRGGSPLNFLPQDFLARKGAKVDLMKSLEKQAAPELESLLKKHTELDKTRANQVLDGLATRLRSMPPEKIVDSLHPKDASFLKDAIETPAVSKLIKHLADEIVPMKLQEREAHEQYRRLSGEEMARLTEQRMFFTPKERRDLAPWHMFETPASQQKVRYGE